MNLGDIVPDFEAETSMGPIKFHEWMGDRCLGCTLKKMNAKKFTPTNRNTRKHMYKRRTSVQKDRDLKYTDVQRLHIFIVHAYLH